jgi:PAS domain-containing protein
MKTADKKKKYPKPLLLLIVMAFVIFSAKALTMLLFAIISPLSSVVEGLVDSVLITLILLPVFYFHLYYPMIEDIKRRETALLVDEFKLPIDSINVPIFGIDNKGKVNEWNQKLVQVTGFQASEILGKSLVEDFISAEYRESVNEVLQKVL